MPLFVNQSDDAAEEMRGMRLETVRSVRTAMAAGEAQLGCAFWVANFLFFITGPIMVLVNQQLGKPRRVAVPTHDAA
jgi:hypothetical protein